MPAFLSSQLSPDQLRNKLVRTVYLSQSFDDPSRMNADVSGTLSFIDLPISIREFLIVTVEVESHDLAVAVDHG